MSKTDYKSPWHAGEVEGKNQKSVAIVKDEKPLRSILRNKSGKGGGIRNRMDRTLTSLVNSQTNSNPMTNGNNVFPNIIDRGNS